MSTRSGLDWAAAGSVWPYAVRRAIPVAESVSLNPLHFAPTGHLRAYLQPEATRGRWAGQLGCKGRDSPRRCRRHRRRRVACALSPKDLARKNRMLIT